MSVATIAIPLFPLKHVLFPQGSVSLQVTESRYMQLIRACIKAKAPFGAVAVQYEAAAKSHAQVELAHTGTLCMVEEVISASHDLLSVRCSGTQRFKYTKVKEGTNNLPIATNAELIAPDVPTLIPPQMQHCSDTLAQLLTALITQGKPSGVSRPFLLDDAGWVSNRWAELLPMDTDTRIALLAMISPEQRLEHIAQKLARAQL